MGARLRQARNRTAADTTMNPKLKVEGQVVASGGAQRAAPASRRVRPVAGFSSSGGQGVRVEEGERQRHGRATRSVGLVVA